MTTTADTAIQQSTVGDTPSKRATKTDTTTKPPPTSHGLQYYEDPRAIRKTIQPSLKEEVDILFDFAMPDYGALTFGNKDSPIQLPTPKDALKGLNADGKAPRYWFNNLVKKYNYKETLWFILNLKATLLSSTNANLLKEWRLSDKVTPQDVQEVGAIASLYEKKGDKDEKIIDKNTNALKEYIFEDDNEEQIEMRKEILLNIALGNVGGLYKEIVKR